MSSIQYSIIGALIPGLVKKAIPAISKRLGLTSFDATTKNRVGKQKYPPYYGFLYGLWVLLLLASGFAVLGIFFALAFRTPEKIAPYIWLGLINAIGGWFILGALIDVILWSMSSEKFRDYIRLRLLKAESGYQMADQIKALFKIGIVYYLILSPVIIYLILKL
ncbi:hypothetical protein HYV44_02245 [Candidatus Microgenomates bacterium]|nr:hypothetical protein [Candidatus Microgenomates bacterium]